MSLTSFLEQKRDKVYSDIVELRDKILLYREILRKINSLPQDCKKIHYYNYKETKDALQSPYYSLEVYKDEVNNCVKIEFRSFNDIFLTATNLNLLHFVKFLAEEVESFINKINDNKKELELIDSSISIIWDYHHVGED